MYLIIAFVIGSIIGLIRGGSFKGLGQRKFSLWFLGLAGIIIQIILHLYCYTGGIDSIDQFLTIANFVSYILILLTLVFNLDDFYTIMIAVGMTANFVVTFINGGKMPVVSTIVEALPTGSLLSSINAGTNAVFSVMQTTTVLWFLGINIRIPFISQISAYMGSVGSLSIGDVFILIGIIGLVQSLLCLKKKDHQTEAVLEDANNQEVALKEPLQDKAVEQSSIFNSGDLEHESEDLFAASNTPVQEVKPLVEESLKIEDSVKEDHDSTKVFTAIGNLNEEDIAQKTDDQKADIAGFFTQSFLANQEKGKLAFDEEAPEDEETKTGIDDEENEATEEALNAIQAQKDLEMPEQSVTKNNDLEEKGDNLSEESQEKDNRVTAEPEKAVVDHLQSEAKPAEPVLDQTVTFEEPVKNLEDLDDFFEDETSIARNTKSFMNTEGEDEMESRRSENEMLNIWQQVNQENKKNNRKRRSKTLTYSDPTHPFKAAKMPKEEVKYNDVQPTPEKKEPKRHRIIEHSLDDGPIYVNPPKRREATLINPIDEQIQENEAAAEQSTVSPYVSVKPKGQKRPVTDEERIDAGYEKVKMSIDGKVVSFWRKKKTK